MLLLTWGADALDQFEAALEYIAEDNPTAARKLDRLFAESLDRACAFPELGRPGRVAGTRELIVHPNYIAVYRITTDAIEVLRVLHARRRYP